MSGYIKPNNAFVLKFLVSTMGYGCLILLFCACSKSNSPGNAPVNPITTPIAPLVEDTSKPYQLVWSDEFNYAGLPDTSKWGYDVGGNGWGNKELQYYTQNRPENARVENGTLIITARKENYIGASYTSARLLTRQKMSWTYGKFEIGAKLPKGRGTWPALWLLSAHQPLKWPDDGEIDIMEEVGFDPGRIHGTIHTQYYNHLLGTQKSNNILVPSAADSFHVYSIEWTPLKIDWRVDGQKYFTYANDQQGTGSWPFNDRFFLIMNIAIGGGWGGQQGVDDSIFPQSMLIDYVRVYQRK